MDVYDSHFQEPEEGDTRPCRYLNAVIHMFKQKHGSHFPDLHQESEGGDACPCKC